MIFEKQFSFRAGHSTNHVLLQLIDQICEFLTFFVDLSKAFNTIDHQIQRKK